MAGRLGPANFQAASRKQVPVYYPSVGRAVPDHVHPSPVCGFLGHQRQAPPCAGRRFLYRTDAEVIYVLIRRDRPDLVVDLCAGLGDAIPYVLLALTWNQHGRLVSVDRADVQHDERTG
jgi:hypothetical protein